MKQYYSFVRRHASWLFLLVFTNILGSSAFAQTTSLGLSSGSGVQGGLVSLNLSLTADPTNLPAGLQWSFSYSAANIASLNVTAGPALTAAGKMVNCNPVAGSVTCLVMGANSTPIASGVVATVDVTLASTAPASITVPISNVMA